MNLQRENNKTILSLDGEMTIARASLLREHLLTSLGQSDEVEIRFDDVEAIDLSCLQLLCSAKRSARDKRKELVIRADNAPVFKQAQTRAGFHF